MACYWAFWVERSCSFVVSRLRNRKLPFKNLEMEMERTENVCIGYDI